MKEMSPNEKNYSLLKNTLLFSAVTVVTSFVVIAIILEGRRAKKENELLNYEVW
jgi:hypothetical protein